MEVRFSGDLLLDTLTFISSVALPDRLSAKRVAKKKTCFCCFNFEVSQSCDGFLAT